MSEETRFKRPAHGLLQKIAELEAENAELKQENFHLKQVKEKWKIRFFKLHDLFDPNGLIEIE